MKRVTINRREYIWEIDNLDSLLTRWRAEYPNSTFQKKRLDGFVVAINGELLRTKEFSSVPISDGDRIVITVGGVAGG
jgi:sulfur carrier protein ThiS